MKSLRRLALLLLAGALFSLGGVIDAIHAQRSRPADGFLQSTAVRVRLGIWDKMDVDKTDHAVFIVSAPNGKQYKSELNQSLDDWAEVDFPDDFSPFPADTNVYTQYTWKCLVGGKPVANGRFMWGASKAADNSVY